MGDVKRATLTLCVRYLVARCFVLCFGCIAPLSALVSSKYKTTKGNRRCACAEGTPAASHGLLWTFSRMPCYSRAWKKTCVYCARDDSSGESVYWLRPCCDLVRYVERHLDSSIASRFSILLLLFTGVFVRWMRAFSVLVSPTISVRCSPAPFVFSLNPTVTLASFFRVCVRVLVKTDCETPDLDASLLQLLFCSLAPQCAAWADVHSPRWR